MTDIYPRHPSDSWRTPPDLFARLDAKHHFELDAAASAENALCARYYTAEDDGLKQPWINTTWANVPYSRNVVPWVNKAFCETSRGVTSVLLLRAATDTKWWQMYVWDNLRGRPHSWVEIEFLKRVKFLDQDGRPQSSARFPSVVVTFKGLADGHIRIEGQRQAGDHANRVAA